MAYWRDNLRKASFRGVEFEVDGRDLAGGRRLVLHEFPRRDEPYIEDMGRKRRTFTVSAYQFGNGYLEPRDALAEALEKEGLGDYVDPWGETRKVAVASYSCSERQRQGGYVAWRITFEEGTDAPGHRTGTDTAAVLRESAERSKIAVLADAIGRWRGTIAEAQAQAAQFLDPLLQGAGLLRQGVGLVNEIAELPGAVLGQLASLALLPTAGIDSLAALAALPETFFGLFDNLISLNVSGATGATGTSGSGRVQAAIAMAGKAGPTAGLPERVPMEQIVPALAYKPENVRVLAETQIALGLLEAVNAAASTEFDTVDDAKDAERAICGGLGALMLTASDSVYTALSQARVALVRDIRTRSANWATLSAATPPQTMPALLLAYRLYGTAARSDDIVTRNRLRHPGFVPGGVALVIRKEPRDGDSE